jgi:hypothetical protein
MGDESNKRKEVTRHDSSLTYYYYRRDNQHPIFRNRFCGVPFVKDVLMDYSSSRSSSSSDGY